MKILRYFIFTLILFWTSLAFPATYYVAQTAAGDGTGSSYANRASIATHNAGSGNFAALDGDTIVLTGTITTTIEMHDSGTSGNEVTYDGDDGVNPAVDIAVGQAAFGIDINGYSYWIIQDVTITDADEGIAGFNNGSHGIIKRCNISGVKDRGLVAGVFDYLIIGGASGDGNTFTDYGTDTAGAAISFAEDVNYAVVSYNKAYDTTGDTYDGIVVMGGHTTSNILYEYNTLIDADYEDGIDIKRANTIIVRFNHISGNANYGIHPQQGSHDIYIYGNSTHDNNWGVLAIDSYTPGYPMYNIHIWSNLIYDNLRPGIEISDGSTASDADATIYDVYVYNNSIYGNAKTANVGAALTLDNGNVQQNYLFKNNIYSFNDTSPYTQLSITSEGTGDTTTDYNTYYYTGQSVNFIWGGVSKTLGEMQALPQEANSAEEDPKFADGANGNFTLDSSSPSIDDGVDLSACFNVDLSNNDAWFETNSGYSTITICYDDALDPNNTDWTTTPPTVAVVDQDLYGIGWERGAYAATGPIISDEYPTSQQACDADPQTVTIGVTSSANANVRYSAKGVDTCTTAYADMDTAFSTGQGTTAHSTDVSQACDGSTTYVVKAQDVSTSLFSNCIEILVDVAAEGGGAPQPAPVSIVPPGNVSIVTGGNVSIE